MHDPTSAYDVLPVRLGDRWFDDGADLELWTEDGRAGVRLRVTRGGELIATQLPVSRGGRARIALDASPPALTVDDPAGVLGEPPADLAWLEARLGPELREVIAQRARRLASARRDGRHGWRDGDRARVSLGERARFCDVFPMSWDVLATLNGRHYAMIDSYRIDPAADQGPIALEVIDLATGARAGLAELEGAHASGRQRQPWRASTAIVDQLLRGLWACAEWARLLSRPAEIARVARLLATWDADRRDPDAVVRDALAVDDDLEEEAGDRAIALGEHAIPALRRALAAEDLVGRCRAARWLATLGDEGGIGVLTAALTDDALVDDPYGDAALERYAIVDDLGRLGARALEPLLGVLARLGAESEQRWIVLEALVELELRDDRTRDALLHELEIDSHAALLLVRYSDGGPAVAEALGRALAQRLALLADDAEQLLTDDDARVLVGAARVLGVLSPELEARIGRALGAGVRAELAACALASGALTDGDDAPYLADGELPPRRAPIRVTARPGRNDPCWCGSGQKYKRCHLDGDAEQDRPDRA